MIWFLAGEEHQAERLSRVNSCCCRGNWTECELAGRCVLIGRRGACPWAGLREWDPVCRQHRRSQWPRRNAVFFPYFLKNLSGSQVSNATLNFIAQRKYNKTNKQTTKLERVPTFGAAAAGISVERAEGFAEPSPNLTSEAV